MKRDTMGCLLLPVDLQLRLEGLFFDLGQGPFWSPVDGDGMKQPEEPRPGEDEPPPKRSRLEEARRIVEEYAADLRKIIEKLRGSSIKRVNFLSQVSRGRAF
jgi:hypothetical protein